MPLTRKILRRLGMYRVSRPGEMKRELPTPRPTPPGWTAGPPDFVGVGAQKAGSTWWFHLIAAHPDVHRDPDRRPEVHYWDHFSHRWPSDEEIDNYRRLFVRPPGKKTGEKTPEYLFDYWAIPMLKVAAPDTKVIVILRDPVERYLSAGAMGTHKGWIRDRFTESNVFQQGLYANQLARLFDVFPREQALVLQYEQCKREPEAQLARTYEFLGLSGYSVAPEELERPRNVTRMPKAELDDKRRRTLIEAYAPDVRMVQTLVPDLDVGLWRNFTPQS